jgi:hypothetical protein
MAAPPEFARRIANIAVRVGEGGERVVRKAFLAIDQAVVMGTPVDKGRARSNWLPGKNGPVSGEREAFVPGEKGSTGAQNAQAAMDAAAAVAATYDGGKDQSLHLTNNLPYIGELNRGSSRQAPALFVEAAVAAGAAAIPGTRILE